MLFNSIDFAVFLPIVFILYWFVFKTLRSQNVLLIVASYVFYAWWDWRFLGLIVASTLIDYCIGLAIDKEERKTSKKLLLTLSVSLNLGILGFFKYYNFFIDNFNEAFMLFGRVLDLNYLNIILPVGISFYTFQTMSYSIDIYREKIKPTTNLIAFASFVCFFPQLVAGPIERASSFLPQVQKRRIFDYSKATDGLKQILWGLFKKMVIADNCAVFVNDIFENYGTYSGSTLVFGAFLFTIQIYCDFSGYSDIAIGVSRLFGFNLKKNFAFPYFSRNIAEFWRRWHISLTTWFKDYFYIPIGGSRGSKWIQLRNTFAIFLVIGLWHGAHWKFVVYGFINALHFVPYIIRGKNTKYTTLIANNRYLPNAKEFFGMFHTFLFLVFARIFFRADSLTIAIDYLNTIFSSSLFTLPRFPNMSEALVLLILIASFFIVEWFGRDKEHALEQLFSKSKRLYRVAFYYAIVVLIFYFNGEEQQFIYFQF
ncbi:MBOAT family O-acyltransferase [Winogradskyella sp. UBA3174]|uniref:MBOAT family O-acyltransferase n=1 Tax=Winogradskyella sp. UBA3174 TaxID=1947785 RepID=UPI0025FC7ECA|nr:MBOAT family O-acyltransferase [Winogradskyella sp. UBA3174]|tara:strand:- start:39802 stop:41247 length:1446 start_codon:yes stop_codon:yes gene_type:complete